VAFRDSALSALQTATTTEEVELAWARVRERFDALTHDSTDFDSLRDGVMLLGVRGALSSAEPSDGPPSVTPRQSLGGRRNRQAPPPGPPPDLGYPTPGHWRPFRLGDVGTWGAGSTPKRGEGSFFGGPHSWFKSGELTDGHMSGPSEETITDRALTECSLRQNQPGDVLIAMYGATIGKTGILDVPATTNQAICACTPHHGIDSEFLALLLRASRRYFIGMGAGGAQPNISREKIVATPISLPPLAEQKRIVARVQALMKTIEHVEAAQRRQAEVHAAFSAAAVHHLDV
jgi:type I restriction enzyme S subunit